MALRRSISKIITPVRPSLGVGRVRSSSTQAASKDQSENPKQTHFGFQTVDEHEKWKKGQKVVRNSNSFKHTVGQCFYFEYLIPVLPEMLLSANV